ncbi:MAG TPA: hypothetical protein VLL05_17515 [Terriglobales bacterium]|nr:hypothetical protein [Terriglobales bacterium]
MAPLSFTVPHGFKAQDPAPMNDDRQKLVIAALVVSALGLAYFMLDWTSQFGHEDWTPIFIFYEDLDPLGHIEKWGLYTPRGELGVIFGVIAPLCLFAAALYLALELRLRNLGR